MTYVDTFQHAGDYNVEYAEHVIYKTFGDVVSVEEKAKTLAKFGFRDDIGTSKATVAGLGAGVLNETLLTSNTRLYVSSSSTSDTTDTITIEYHTVSGTGNDAQFTFGTVAVALNGQTEVDTGVDVARVSRMYVSDGSADLVGTVYAYTTSGNSSGVPTTAASVRCAIPAGDNQSFKAATTFSNTDYFIMTGGWVSFLDKTAGVATCEFQIKAPGRPWRTQFIVGVGDGGPSAILPLTPYFIVPKNYDVRVIASADGTNTAVSAVFNGYLASVQS